jgi:hypothetical protein
MHLQTRILCSRGRRERGWRGRCAFSANVDSISANFVIVTVVFVIVVVVVVVVVVMV